MKIKICLYIVIMLLLTGCATLQLVSLGISGMSYLTTGKSLSDHAISIMAEQDCALHRVVLDEMVCRKTNRVEQNTLETQVAKIDIPFEPELLVKSSVKSTLRLSTQIKTNNKQLLHAPVRLKPRNNTVEYYKVIGSFNNKAYAITRAILYQNLNAKVILSDDHRHIKYRVVYGPVAKNTKISRINKITDTEKQPDWLIGLCKNNLQPPPCNDQSQNAILAKINF